MKKRYIILPFCLIASMLCAGTFTDVNSSKYWGKTGLKDLTTTIDANFALIEAGTAVGALASGKIWVGNSGGTGAAVTVSGDLRLSNTGVASIPAAAVELTNCSSAVQSSLGKADTAIQSGATFNAAAAAYNVSGFTNGVLGTSRGGAGTASGILKANGSGVVSAATAGTDYNGPSVSPVYSITASQNVTSNTFAVAAITKKVVILKSTGEGYTVTLPAPGTAGKELSIWVDATQGTNTFVIPDDGTLVECGSDWTGSVNDVINFTAETTAKWRCTSKQDND